MTVAPINHPGQRQATPSHQRIPSLDGLRAISILLVFLAHAGLDALIPGGVGVTVFFFLSGFLITTLLRAEYATTGGVNFRHFWLRRALRILPPFYLVLIGATLLTVALFPPGAVSARAVGAQALHVTNYWIIWHGYGGQPMGTGVYWSLAVEEHFYLLFPLLYVAMRKCALSGRTQAMLLWTLCAIVLIWRCILVLHFHVAADRTYLASDTRIDSILFGCALAVWNNPVLDGISVNERRWKLVVVPAAAILLLCTFLYRNPVFRETARYSLQGLALTPMFIAAVRMPDWLPFRILNTRPLIFLGVLSYSLYLVHLVLIFSVQKCLPGVDPVTQGALAFVMAVAISWGIYRTVEKPAAKLRRRLTDW